MTDIKGNLKTLRRCGFEPLEPFILPAQDWWRNYYRPLQARIERLRAQAESDPDLAEALEVTTREIELFERHGDSYGYVFYVARKVA
jgi:serine/threonine-protein kinase HipA